MQCAVRYVGLKEVKSGLNGSTVDDKAVVKLTQIGVNEPRISLAEYYVAEIPIVLIDKSVYKISRLGYMVQLRRPYIL
jgi:hypothetical protein